MINTKWFLMNRSKISYPEWNEFFRQITRHYADDEPLNVGTLGYENNDTPAEAVLDWFRDNNYPMNCWHELYKDYCTYGPQN
jgi:hypothetical protein